MAKKPKRSHRAYKEWAPSVRELEQNIIIITHGEINGRATVNLKINILDSRTNHSSRLKKSAIVFPNAHPTLDCDLSGEWCYPTFEQLGLGV